MVSVSRICVAVGTPQSESHFEPRRSICRWAAKLTSISRTGRPSRRLSFTARSSVETHRFSMDSTYFIAKGLSSVLLSLMAGLDSAEAGSAGYQTMRQGPAPERTPTVPRHSWTR